MLQHITLILMEQYTFPNLTGILWHSTIHTVESDKRSIVHIICSKFERQDLNKRKRLPLTLQCSNFLNKIPFLTILTYFRKASIYNTGFNQMGNRILQFKWYRFQITYISNLGVFQIRNDFDYFHRNTIYFVLYCHRNRFFLHFCSQFILLF